MIFSFFAFADCWLLNLSIWLARDSQRIGNSRLSFLVLLENRTLWSTCIVCYWCWILVLCLKTG